MLGIITILLIAVMAFVYELLDSATGQGYGTLGSPSLLLMGFASTLVVPAELFSQVIGDFSSAFFHNKWKNANFSHWKSPDVRRALIITAAGVIGVVIAAWLGASIIPKSVMTTYIGIVVTAVGLLMLSGISLKFTYKKLIALGAVSAFNKGMSGGGYGPVVAGGQVVIGEGAKNSIGITDLAEGPICIAGFVTWSLIRGISAAEIELMVPLSIGALLAPVLGTWITYKVPTAKLRRIMGVIIVILGVLTLAKILSP